MAVRKISIEKSKEALVDLSHKLYPEDIQKEKKQYWERALSKENPFWQFGKVQGFILEEGKILSHVIASHDRRNPAIGFLGFFESEHVPSLPHIQEAIQFLLKEGVQKIFCPCDFSILTNYRFNDGGIEKVFHGEPINPKYYVEQIQKEGFSPFNHYVSGVRTDFTTILPYVVEERSDEFFVREIHVDQFLEDLYILYDLQKGVFEGSSNYYIPVSLEEFLYWYLPLKEKINPRYLEFVYKGDTPVGFCYSFVEGKTLVMKTIGVLPKFQGTGASRHLIYSQHKKAKEDGIEKIIYALVRVGNNVTKMTYSGVTPLHTYTSFILSSFKERS